MSKEPDRRPSTRLGVAAGALSEASWPAALLLCALYFNPSSARAFEPDKLAWLILLALLGLLGLAIGLAERPASAAALRGALLRPLPLAALAIGLSLLLGSLLSPVPAVALWGAYRRGQGLWSGLAMLGVFTAAAATGGRAQTRERLPQLLSIAVVPAALYALLQRLGFDSLQWSIYGGGPSERAFGPLGNPIFLGAWLAMALPLSLAALVSALGDARDRRAGAGRRALGHGLAVTLALAGLAASQSRGPLLGLAAGLAVFAMLAALRQGRRSLALGGLLSASLGLAILVGLGRLGLPGLERFGQLLALGSRTARSRQLIWEAMGDLARSAPGRIATGYGPDSLAYVLPRHLPEAVIQLTPEQYYDRAHNLLWETWVSAGLLGVLALLLLYWAAFDQGLQQLGLLRRPGDRRLLAAAMLGGAALGWLTPALAGSPALSAPGAMAGLLAAALASSLLLRGGSRPSLPEHAPERRGARRKPGAGSAGRGRSQDGRAGDAKTRRPWIAASWLTIGLLAALSAHWVEAMVGLPTAAGDSLAWACLGLLAARPEGGGLEAPRSTAAIGGLIEGLALAAVLMAPVLLPSIGATIEAWPILLLVPSLWLVAELVNAGGQALAQRRLARLSVAGGFALLLGLLQARPGGELIAFTLTLIGSLLAVVIVAWRSREADRRGSVLRRVVYVASAGACLLVGSWLALRPVLADVHARQGQELMARAELGPAIDAFERARSLWAQQAIYGALLASAYEARMLQSNREPLDRVADFEASLEALQRARALAPDDHLALRLGNLHRARGDASARSSTAKDWWRQADAHYAAALAIHPSNPQALLERAALLERLGEVSAAREGYARAFRLNPRELRAAAGSLRMTLVERDLPAAELALAQLGQQGGDLETLQTLLARPAPVPAWATEQALAHILVLGRLGSKATALAQLEQLATRQADEPFLVELRSWLDGPSAP